jgi:hypothetical protein
VGHDKELHDGTTSFACMAVFMQLWKEMTVDNWDDFFKLGSSKKKQSLMLPSWLLQWAIGLC